ncbi:MAG: HEAT repeat domain-containing protein, partial [Elusimicrobia bacterium]|nr:HEAT repeat domain-containing protein [Elusimicrobiota bacterium]
LDAVMGAIRSNSPAQAAWLINDFNSESVPAIRAWMIRGVADVAPRQGLSLFEQGLKDQSPWVRLAAVDSLGKMGTPQAVSDLAGVLSQEMNPGVRQSAAYWLGKIGGALAVAALGQSLTADSNPNVRVQAAQALLAAGTPQARRALAAGENDADERVRQIAHGR